MTDMATAPPRTPLEPQAAKVMMSEVWSQTIRTFRATPWKYVALVLLPYPFAALSPLMKVSAGTKAAAIPAIVGMLLQYFFQFVGQSASIYGAGQSLSGAGWTLGEAIGVGIKRVLPLLGMAFVVGVPVLIAVGVIATCVAFLGKAGLLGLVLIIPLVMVLAAFMLGQQACIIERKGPIESLRRSAFLTRNNRWRLIGILLLFLFLPLLLIIIAFGMGVAIVVAIHSTVLSVVAGILAFLAAIPVFIAYQAILTIVLAVAFIELRALKEGGGPRQTVAGVFD